MATLVQDLVYSRAPHLLCQGFSTHLDHSTSGSWMWGSARGGGGGEMPHSRMLVVGGGGNAARCRAAAASACKLPLAPTSRWCMAVLHSPPTRAYPVGPSQVPPGVCIPRVDNSCAMSLHKTPGNQGLATLVTKFLLTCQHCRALPVHSPTLAPLYQKAKEHSL